MENIKLKIASTSILVLFISSLAFAQVSNKQWWDNLSPAWKKMFYKEQFKGKEIEPNEGQLEEIVKLRRINCSKNKEITSLKPLAQLTFLERIKCSDCPNLESLEGIENLTNLKELDCSNNDGIADLNPVSGLAQLEKLNCGNTMVKSLHPLLYLVNLKVLDLHYTTINDLEFLRKLRKLVKLDVSNNTTLYSIEGVGGLVNLEEFYCSKTDIESLDPLAKCVKLRILDVSDTQVNSIRALQKIKPLVDINLNNTNVNTLKYLYASPNLMMISVRNTKISKSDINRSIEAIKKVVYKPENIVFETD